MGVSTLYLLVLLDECLQLINLSSCHLSNLQSQHHGPPLSFNSHTTALDALDRLAKVDCRSNTSLRHTAEAG